MKNKNKRMNNWKTYKSPDLDYFDFPDYQDLEYKKSSQSLHHKNQSADK